MAETLKLDIAILGPGAVGGTLAAAFWKAGHRVTCVAKEETAAVIREKGLRVESATLGDFTARPDAVARLKRPCDVLFVTTKGHQLASALERIDASVLSPSTFVIPLLNGVEHMPLLRARFSCPVVGGSIQVESKYVAPGCSRHTSPFARVDLGTSGLGEADRERISRLARVLSEASVDFFVGRSEGDILWGKLVRLNALALTTAAANRGIGFIRDNPEWRSILLDCIDEALLVARAEGVQIGHDEVMARVNSLPDELGTSLQRDVHEGRPSEIDFIPGSVLSVARRHGLECPTIEKLMGEVREIADRKRVSP